MKEAQWLTGPEDRLLAVDTEGRIILVQQNIFTDDAGKRMTRIKIQQSFPEEDRPYEIVLHAWGEARVRDITFSPSRRAMLLGRFRGSLSFGNRTLVSHGTDLFFLIIDAWGHAVSFRNLGGPMQKSATALMGSPFGEFEIQGFMSHPKTAETFLFRFIIDENGRPAAFERLATMDRLLEWTAGDPALTLGAIGEPPPDEVDDPDGTPTAVLEEIGELPPDEVDDPDGSP